jgi:hypothetical protein
MPSSIMRDDSEPPRSTQTDHGNEMDTYDDQIVPIADSALLSAKLVKKGTLKVYKGLPQGMCTTNPEQINPDLLAFIKS